MARARWYATVVDSPGFEPFAVVGDLVLAVRTPRSRDFVTVEVAPMSLCGAELAPTADVRLTPTPPPRLRDEWQGEVHLGDPVRFLVAGGSYRLTLDRLAETPEGLPWVVCDFCLERD
jgi:hypothetical protein